MPSVFTPEMARQIGIAASEFQHRQTGQQPKATTVVLSNETLVITLHGALSKAELDVSQSPEGVAKMQEYHRNLFKASVDTLRAEIKRITGVAVREAAVEIEPVSGSVIHAFTSGDMVQVFLLNERMSSGERGKPTGTSGTNGV